MTERAPLLQVHSRWNRSSGAPREGSDAPLREVVNGGWEEEGSDDDGVVWHRRSAPSSSRRGGYAGHGLGASLLFSWMNPLFDAGAAALAAGRRLTLPELSPLPASDATAAWAAHFRAAVEDTDVSMRSPLRRLLSALWVAFGRRWVRLGVGQFVVMVLSFVGPLCLNGLLATMQHPPSSEGEGVRSTALWTSALVGGAALSAAASTQLGFQTSRLQIWMRAGLVSALFERVLVIQEGDGRGGVGAGVTRMSVDVQKVTDAASSSHQAWSLPIQVGVTLYLLYTQVQWAFLAGLGVLAVFLPLNVVVARRIGAMTRGMMTHKDERVRQVAVRRCWVVRVA